jgi:riboflavin kinase/FMN adenylyltransferase
LLTSHAHKLELLGATGVDAVLVVAFTPERAREAPEAFVDRVLVGALAARTVIVGEDFHFGHRRGGNVGLLREVGARRGFEVLPVDLVSRADGVDEPVSSTAIRRALAGGDVAGAARMLGRDHEVRGRVVHGDRRGHEIGFPTANVAVEAEACLPADGVYAGLLAAGDGAWRGCAINLGRRPTFVDRSAASLLEAHVLDFDGDLYDAAVRVTFAAFLRGERKFDGVASLAAQLKLDVDHARTLLAR